MLESDHHQHTVTDFPQIWQMVSKAKSHVMMGCHQEAVVEVEEQLQRSWASQEGAVGVAASLHPHLPLPLQLMGRSQSAQPCKACTWGWVWDGH